MNQIDKIGVEIEGGWNEPDCICREDMKNPDCKLTALNHCFGHDGSVEDLDTERHGEVVSHAFDNLNDCLEWMDFLYPDESNRTCGIHIHLSFTNLQSYVKLMDRRFYNALIGGFNTWGNDNRINPDSAFWHRLEGRNSYCENKFVPDDQVNVQHKDSVRYAHLNYCYSLHRTMELRLLPTFQKRELAFSAVRFYYGFVNSWLKSRKITNYNLGESICV